MTDKNIDKKVVDDKFTQEFKRVRNKTKRKRVKPAKNAKKKSNPAVKMFLLSVFLIILMFAVGFVGINIVMTAIVGTGNEVAVPDITGLSFDVARKKMMDMNLFVQQIDMQHHDEIAANRIIHQKPEAGKQTKINRTVEVIVSKGPELVKVPYLDSITELEAKIRLENFGLKLGAKSHRYSADVAKDRIITSQPAADDFVPKGSTVNIVISLGELPDASQRRDRHRDLLDRNN